MTNPDPHQDGDRDPDEGADQAEGQASDGWHLLWEVGDQDASDETYRWHHDRLDELPADVSAARRLLSRVLGEDDRRAADTAAIGLARLGERSLDDRLGRIARSAERSLPMRRAAIETLGLAADGAESAKHIVDALLAQFGRFDGDDRTGYIPALHAESIAARARHVPPQDESRFLAALASPADEVRIAALQALAKSGPGHLPAQIDSLIDDQQSQVRIAALQAVAGCQQSTALPRVLAAAKDRDLPVRLEAIRTLGALGGDQARAALTDILASQSEHPRAAAVEALAQAGDLTSVLAVASDPSWRVRRQVAATLGQHPDPRSKEILRVLLQDRSVEVAVAAVESLAQWPLESGLPLLLEAAASQTPRISHAATRQLSQRCDAAQGLEQTTSHQQLREQLARLQQQLATQSNETAREALAREEAVSQEQDGPNDSGQQLATFDSQLAAVDQLGQPDLPRRREAAKALARMAAQHPLEPQALKRLATAVTTETDTEVWRSVLETIAAQDSPPACDLAYAAATSASPDIRRRACQYMHRHGSPQHALVLLGLLEDTDIAVVRQRSRRWGRAGPWRMCSR